MPRFTIDFKKVRSLRRENGVTIKQAAGKLDISDVQYSKKERGIAPFKGNELCVLSEMYGVTPGIFFTNSVRN